MISPMIKNIFDHLYRRMCLSFALGLIIGVIIHYFLLVLAEATDYRQNHPLLIWALPFAGLLLAYARIRWSASFQGSDFVKSEVQQGKKYLPSWMGITAASGTLWTHLFGGSAGRESTAIQMGASLSDFVSAQLDLDASTRLKLLIASISAGFCGAVGAPWAALLFGIEWTSVYRGKYGITETLFAVSGATLAAYLLRTTHLSFKTFEALPINQTTLSAIIVLGVLSALLAFILRLVSYLCHRAFVKFKIKELYQPFVAGCLLIGIYQLWGLKFAGLGIDSIYLAAQSPATFGDALIKSVTTGITLGGGFMGGEFIPSVYVGTHLASAISDWTLPSHLSMFPLGFASVFAGLFAAPLTGTLMIVEFFGTDWWLPALLSCSLSHFLLKTLIRRFLS